QGRLGPPLDLRVNRVDLRAPHGPAKEAALRLVADELRPGESLVERRQRRRDLQRREDASSRRGKEGRTETRVRDVTQGSPLLDLERPRAHGPSRRGARAGG